LTYSEFGSVDNRFREWSPLQLRRFKANGRPQGRRKSVGRRIQRNDKAYFGLCNQ